MDKPGRTRMFKLLVPLLAASLLSGCWDNRELSQLGIASGTAYDWENGEWKATYQIINPSSGVSGISGSGGSTSSPPFLTYVVKGKTIMDAIDKTNMTSTRQMFFSHSRITVLSERLARKGVEQLIDIFLRKPDARETVYVFIAEDEVEKILEQLMQMSKNQGVGIQQMIEQEAKLTSYFPSVRLFQLAMELVSDSRCAIVPEIKIVGGAPITSTDELGTTDPQSRLELGRLAVLKEGKQIGWLSQAQAFGLAFMRDTIQQAIISFPSMPSSGDQDDASFNLLNSDTSVKAEWKDDHYVMNIDIKGHGVVTEVGGAMDLTERETLTGMEKGIEENIIEIVDASWRAVKGLNADVTNFAGHIHRQHPKRWKEIQERDNWDEVFQNIEIRTTASIQIERMGLSNKSFKSTGEKK